MSKKHTYTVNVEWSGNLGTGTSGYSEYSRQHNIIVEGKPVIIGSSDPVFNGDPTRYNPEELLIASLSSCHMLWYLHLCSDANITIVEYIDQAHGVMTEEKDGSGKFQEVTLSPVITILKKSNKPLASELHKQAHSKCFIANSVNFPVQCQPTILIASNGG